ncbi:MAG: FdxN element excision controlling factor protein XisH, partial [Cyanobacteriota bacterium]
MGKGWYQKRMLFRISESIKLQIDLAAESAIGAEKDSEKIAVEIK